MGKLPTPKDNDSASLERIKAVRGLLDGLMAVGNGHVPSEATDIGDVTERPNPRASDLRYPEGFVCHVERERSRVYLHDSPNWALASGRYVGVGGDTFIEELRCWA